MNWLEQALELEARGQVGSAIALLEQAVAIGDESAQIYRELARLCLLVNEVRAFSNYCHEAIRIDPADGTPYLMIGRYLTAARRWAEAVESLDKAQSAALTAEQRTELTALQKEAHAGLAAWEKANPGHNPLAF